ncbi:hypothetical protein, conserved [Thermococcus kodakarensis KOD1]|uniref:Uncharacterized protein n=1 Tax=Thermococcus kodakarensis (strain ATCC BAA-918 / JCM 12380 / KOD1) TaxID=69014 RepID=Q5JGS0_THEKO|nr:hypothetical protein [Thermococcus kodakarensis]WCN27293.1 hypothetical protein POG15_06635 [Thermococcus kodakarensis]WCN29580.1 hypothetical protein POG21_06625 [Thermococcus kodakarensis]BAD85493.1 hypothetical protein, conserved [Thermococcus kodakarensis KOD1]
MVKRVSKLKRIDGITHGSHIDTVYPDPAVALNLLMEGIKDNEPRIATVELNVGKILPRKKTVNVWIYDVSFGDDVFMRSLLIEDSKKKILQFATAFPVLNSETSVEFEVNEILEWANRLEANVSGKVIGEETPYVSFFAVDYIERKADYLELDTARAKLAFLAYWAKVGPIGDKISVSPQNGEPVQINLEDAELLLPASFKGAFMDDYAITGRVLRVKPSRTLYGDGYLIRLKSLPLGEIDLFVLREHLKGENKEIKEGEMLTAVGWLQGGLV